ncbi:MAG: DUF1893 domain-containing protein, partial [Fusobacteriaceae bacterium]
MEKTFDVNFEEKCFMAYKNSEMIFSCSNNLFGILPAFLFYKKGKYFTSDSEIFDKVTGKGSAMLLANSNCKKISTGMISESALEYFKKFKMEVKYKKLVPYIINKTGDGKCPVETMLENIF